MNPDDVQRQILLLMKRPDYRPCKMHGLMTQMNLGANTRKSVRQALRDLTDRGMIQVLSGNRYALADSPTKEREVIGILNLHAQGFGFLTVEPNETDGGPPALEELFVPPGALGAARHGDRVRAKVLPSRKPRGDSTLNEGEVIEVIQHATTLCVGTLRRVGGSWQLMPDDPRFRGTVRVRDTGGIVPQARHKAVLRLDERFDPGQGETGVLVEILGHADDPGVDILAIMRAHGLDSEFPEAVVREAKSFVVAVTPRDLEERRDLRKDLIFTIDPVDARDFDDALSIQPLAKGGFRVGIHIADVAHFVKRGGAMDVEAQARGTSAYLVDRVVTMLPVNLTNDLCSLVPHQDRLAHSVILDINTQGKVTAVDTCRSVIHSQQRLTYEQAQVMLDGGTIEGVAEPVRDAVLELGRLTRKLRKNRMSEHALAFDMPETRCVLDGDGNVTGFTHKLAVAAYNLVEECMLMANREVGALLAGRFGTAIYRIHEEPTLADFEGMAEDLRQLGLENLPEVSRLTLNEIVGRDMPEPMRQAVTITLLKNMNRALYSADLGEHFGLAFDTYTHFTSPIRRYPDLIAQRMLEALEKNKPNPYGETELRRLCLHCSERERAAEHAESATIEVKRVAYYHDKLFKGETGPYAAKVSQVIPRGLLVELDESGQRGLVPFHAMDGDYYEVNSTGTQARGRKSGRVIQLGDPFPVHLAQVDTELRRIDFIPDQDAVPASPLPPPPKPEEKKQKARPASPKPKAGKGKSDKRRKR